MNVLMLVRNMVNILELPYAQNGKKFWANNDQDSLAGFCTLCFYMSLGIKILSIIGM